MNTEPDKHHVILTQTELDRIRHLVLSESKNVVETRGRVTGQSHMDRLLATYQAELNAIRTALGSSEQLPPSALCVHANELLQELKQLVEEVGDSLTTPREEYIKALIAKAEGLR